MPSKKDIKNGKIFLTIIKNKAKKVLIIKRLREEIGYDGKVLTWAFPGGKMEEGETAEQAVVREVSQETGFNIKVKKMISERKHPQIGVKIKYFSCEIVPGKIRPIEDIHEVDTLKWIDTKELKDHFTTDLDPGVAKYLKL